MANDSLKVEVTSPDLDKLIARLDAYPGKLDEGMKTAMGTTLLVMTESIPGYPPEPATSTYDRTGTLGKTLGSSMEGGKSGEPDVYEVKALGTVFEGHFGSNLEYAPYVVGDDTQAAHMKHWWTLSKVAEKALDKITRVWQALADAMVKFVEGR
jgi:hypothetical protein